MKDSCEMAGVDVMMSLSTTNICDENVVDNCRRKF